MITELKGYFRDMRTIYHNTSPKEFLKGALGVLVSFFAPFALGVAYGMKFLHSH